MKRFISACCALVLGIGCFSVAASAEQTEPTRFFRTSISGTNVAKNGWNFSFALSAYSNGNIHIDVQCEKSHTTNDCNQIGSIQFDDSVIAAIGEAGYADTSSFSNSGNGSSKYTTSYNSDKIVYNAIYSGHDSFNHLTGSTLMSFDLYVKEAYLTSSVSLTFFGKALEIPFGSETPQIDNTELQNTITKLKAENEELSKKNTELSKTVSELETLNTELDTANKKYQTESENLKTQNQALSTSILKFETENSTLKDNLATFDTDGDGLLTSADAQMILVYYAEYLAGATSGKTGDYAAFIQTFKGQ